MKKEKLSKSELDTIRRIIKENDAQQTISHLSYDQIEKAWNNIPEKDANKLYRVGESSHTPMRIILTGLPDNPSYKSKVEKAVFKSFSASLIEIAGKSKASGGSELPIKVDKNRKKSDQAILPTSPPDTEASELPIKSTKDKDSELTSIPSDSKGFKSAPVSKEIGYSELATTSVQTKGFEPATAPPETKVPDSPTVAPEVEVYDTYALKNGKVGEEYSDTLDFDKIHPGEKINDYTVDGLEEIGLELDSNKRLIKGMPKKAGDPSQNYEFELTVRYETDNAEEASRKKISIKILPDPKLMWKNLEPPKESEDRKPHEYKKLIRLKEDKNGKERLLIAASKRGRSHAHKALFRDDHVEIEYLKELGWSVLAVADGAGSAHLSRVGSQIGCKTALKHITGKLGTYDDELTTKIKATVKNDDIVSDNRDDKALRKLLYEITAAAGYESAKAIHEEAGKRRAEVKNFSTTLLLAIHKQFDFGDFVASFWVGDGALAIYSESKGVQLLGVPDAGEFSGETMFVTMNRVLTPEELAKRICYAVTDDFTALFAMTDGVSDPKFVTEKNLENSSYWDNLWNNLQKAVFDTKEDFDTKLLEWLDFWAEGEHDDRTIAILF